ncbi:hypothetical protein AAG906_037931 [Vitis piasezkii]
MVASPVPSQPARRAPETHHRCPHLRLLLLLPATPLVPPIAPTTSEPSITISALEFRTLDTTILRQIQQHLGLLPPSQPDLPTFSTPIGLADDTIPAEVRIPPPQDEPPTVTATLEDASSPPEAPTT